MNDRAKLPDRLWRNRRGSVSIEFAAIGAILLVSTLGAFELGRVLFVYHRLETAVGAATRLMQMKAPNDAIIDSVSSRFTEGERQFLTIEYDPDYTDRDSGATYQRIDARYALPLMIPNLNLFPESPYRLHAMQLIPIN